MSACGFRSFAPMCAMDAPADGRGTTPETNSLLNPLSSMDGAAAAPKFGRETTFH